MAIKHIITDRLTNSEKIIANTVNMIIDKINDQQDQLNRINTNQTILDDRTLSHTNKAIEDTKECAMDKSKRSAIEALIETRNWGCTLTFYSSNLK